MLLRRVEQKTSSRELSHLRIASCRLRTASNGRPAGGATAQDGAEDKLARAQPSYRLQVKGYDVRPAGGAVAEDGAEDKRSRAQPLVELELAELSRRRHDACCMFCWSSLNLQS